MQVKPYPPYFQWWLADADDAPRCGGPASRIGHENCRHREYRLTCLQYDRLLTRAAGRCEICAKPDHENCFGKLFIDHVTKLGKWAVRGLLCRTCNGNLHYPSRWRPEIDAYHANAFYLTLAAEAGVYDLSPPEPPVWTVLSDHAHRPWRREPEGWWPHHPRAELIAPRSWASLLYLTGAHNLRPSQLPTDVPPLGDGPIGRRWRRVCVVDPPQAARRKGHRFTKSTDIDTREG